MGRNRKRPNEDGQWQCTFCFKWKDNEQFYQSTSNSNGLQSRCIDCMRLSQFANHLANGIPAYLETLFPFAENQQLTDFEEVLKEWKRYPPSSKAGKIMADNVREWLAFFEAHNPDVTPRTRKPSTGTSSDRIESERTNVVRPKPGSTAKLGGYEVTFVGPPQEAKKPAWWDLEPTDMTDAQYDEWVRAGVPFDPTKRSL